MGKDIISHTANYPKRFCERKNYNCFFNQYIGQSSASLCVPWNLQNWTTIWGQWEEQKKMLLFLKEQTLSVIMNIINIYITVPNNNIQMWIPVDMYDNTKIFISCNKLHSHIPLIFKSRSLECFVHTWERLI